MAAEPLAAPFIISGDDVPSIPAASSLNGNTILPPNSSLQARLEGIENAQARFGEDLEKVRLKLKGVVDDDGSGELTTISWKAKEKMREAFVEERFENADMNTRVDNLQSRTEGLESRMDALEKTVEGVVETIKLE